MAEEIARDGTGDAFERLYASLHERRRPEDIAQTILEAVGPSLTRPERALLEKAARGSLKRQVFGYTSMLESFRRPVGAGRQVAKAGELFATAYPLSAEECEDPEAVAAFARHVGAEIGKASGVSDFLKDRLNGDARRDAGLELSRRRYNKLFRHAQRLERKASTLAREWRKYGFTLAGKSGLASELSRDEFLRDADTACFVAYYTARLNRRSEFTNGPQERAMDVIADTLLGRCRQSGTANWWAVAHVLPDAEALSRLSDARRGELMGRWFSLLQDVARLLREVWDRSDINRVTMIVRRGNDSSTWNQTAAAWNRARDHWIALLYASGMEAVLTAVCPGKALRLMAADVAQWHRASGGGLDPNTDVWSDLPLPWETLLGETDCTRADIEAACRRHGLDPIKSGWVAPRPRDTPPVPFRPTPELVHGVTVGSPFLAERLRRAGVFSGKYLKPQHLSATGGEG